MLSLSHEASYPIAHDGRCRKAPDNPMSWLTTSDNSLFRPPAFYGGPFYSPLLPGYVVAQQQVPTSPFLPPTEENDQVGRNHHSSSSYASAAPEQEVSSSSRAEDMRVVRDLKQRLLRPPDIHIVEPPAAVVSSAPLSAPPLNHHSRQPRVPTYFAKGSVIQLANGQLKRVEDLRTEDFLQSAELSPDLRIDSSTVLRIELPSPKTALLGFSVGHNKVQVTVEAAVEHPFFVFNRGWASCCPERSLQRYGLSCYKLELGNVCISLTHKDSSRIKKNPVLRKRRSSAPS